jgi:hypothetical protein
MYRLNFRTVISAVLLSFLLTGCSPEEEQSETSENAVTKDVEYAPDEVSGKTFCAGSASVSTVDFTNETSCSLTNYELSDGYNWNEHPTYSYTKKTSNTATLIVRFAIIASGSGYVLTKYNTYTYHLEFTAKKKGAYEVSHYFKWKKRIGTTLTYETNTVGYSGSFTLS